MRSRTFPVFNPNFVNHLFRDHISVMLKRWIDLNYRLIRSQAKVRFLLLCKYNNIFPTHFSRLNTGFYQLDHHITNVKLERVLHTSKEKILKLEIYELNRTCEMTIKELSHISWNLLNAIPFDI